MHIKFQIIFQKIKLLSDFDWDLFSDLNYFKNIMTYALPVNGQSNPTHRSWTKLKTMQVFESKKNICVEFFSWTQLKAGESTQELRLQIQLKSHWFLLYFIVIILFWVYLKALKWNDESEILIDSNNFQNDGYDPRKGCHVNHRGKHFFIGNWRISKTRWDILIHSNPVLMNSDGFKQYACNNCNKNLLS